MEEMDASSGSTSLENSISIVGVMETLSTVPLSRTLSPSTLADTTMALGSGPEGVSP